jgi:flagellar biosynthesis/type III secretory pathway chaperone
MLDRAHTLAAILERMIVLYERCLDVMARERNTLVLVDFDALLESIREKDEILAAIRGLDRDRLRIQDEFAIVMDTPVNDLTLRLLAENLQKQGGDAKLAGDRLLSLRRRLAAVIEVLGEKVKHNKVFVDRSIQNLQEVAAHWSSVVLGKSRDSAGSRRTLTYTEKARMSTQSDATGSLVERKF